MSTSFSSIAWSNAPSSMRSQAGSGQNERTASRKPNRKPSLPESGLVSRGSAGNREEAVSEEERGRTHERGAA